MQMSDNDIQISYRAAKEPEKQIKILAELNACPEHKIRSILGLPPVENPDKSGEELAAKIRELHAQNLSDGEIGKIVGLTGSTICWWRKKLGLSANRHGAHKKPAEGKPNANEERRVELPPCAATEEKTAMPAEAGWYESNLERGADLVSAYRLVLCDLIQAGCIKQI